VVGDREVWEKELRKTCREKKKESHEVAESDFNPNRWICKGIWQRINTSFIHDQREKVERRQELAKTEFVKVITVVDRERNMDHRSGPKVFTNS
jgi:gas vesicle protein